MQIKPEWSRGFVVLRDRELVVWRRFTAIAPRVQLEPAFDANADGEHELTLEIEIDGDGRPRCTGISVRGPQVTATALGALPMSFLVPDVVAAAAVSASNFAIGARTGSPIEPGSRVVRSRDEARQLLPARSRSSRPRSKLTPEHLKAVAGIYRGHVKFGGTSPNVAIASEYGCDRSTAARWVSEARKAEYLKPARTTYAGERD